jgi:hypothetical protein
MKGDGGAERGRTAELLNGSDGCVPMTSAVTTKGTRLYRYYVPMDVIRSLLAPQSSCISFW